MTSNGWQAVLTPDALLRLGLLQEVFGEEMAQADRPLAMQAEDLLAAAQGADAVLLLTEWQQFRQLDWPASAAVIRQPAWLFDARAVGEG